MTAFVRYRSGAEIRQNFDNLFAAQVWIDANHPTGDALIRHSHTSDGTLHERNGFFYGRALAIRERGRWVQL